MNNIIQTIRHAARAATVLLLALLAAQTAGAQTNVSNAGGLASAFGNPTVSVVNVTDNITGVGMLSLNHALTINLNGHTISGDGLHFEVDPGRSLTINGGGQDSSVGNIISGNANGPAINNGGTVTLRNVNIITYPGHAINGDGTLNIGDNVSFKYISDIDNASGLETALNDPNVGVVNVTDNITGVGMLSLNHALTINLNGHTISGDGLHIVVYEGCSLTINGGDGSVGNIIRGNAEKPAINNNGTVTLSNVNIITYRDNAINGDGTLNIGDNVSFISNIDNAAGLVAAFDDTNVSVINVTDNITGVGGLLPLDRDLTINLNGHTISGDYLHIDVGPGHSLTINGGGQGGSVGNIISGYAYAPAINNRGTVTLSHVNITTNYDFAIGDTGMLYIGNNVSFNGWTEMPFRTPNVNTEDGNYNYDPGNPLANVVATVTVGGKTHYFENSGAALTYIVSHPDNDHFSLSGTTYTIHTATGWDAFCSLLADNDKGFFTGKTVKLDDDITVTRMAGSDYHDFTGTFDGQGHTLTFNYGEDGNPASDEYAAPFSKITNDNNVAVTIRNLHVSGHIYTSAKYAAGIVGRHWGTLNIVNCRSSIAIHSSVSGDGTHAGFEAINSGTVNIEGCLFDGKLLTVNTGETATINCAGFVGYGNGNVTNSLYAPAALADGETEVGAGTANENPSCTFARDAATVSNSYYTRQLGTAQGKQARVVSAGQNVTISNVALTGSATTYDVSGITAYTGGGLTRTVDQATTLYYGQGDVLSLTLQNPQPAGVTCTYTADDGTLNGNDTDGYTLTMPDADVTIGASWSATYIDKNGKQQSHDVTLLKGTETSLRSGWYVATGTLNYTKQLKFTGNANIILADDCQMNVGSSDSRIRNIGIYGYNSVYFYDLTIYGQTAGTGAVNVYVTGAENWAIGGKKLTINGGNITADANGDDACAIAANANLTINGGQVTATASGDAFALASNSDITINGGNVTATGTGSAYGITAKGNITISSGTVTATGGNDGYGICADYNVNINGGNVTISGYGGICANNGDITLGWTNATDRIYASSYYLTSGSGTVTIADGHKLYNGKGFLSGTVSTSAAVNGKTLQPALSTAYITAQGTAADDPADAIVLSPDQTTLGAHNYVALGTLNYTTGLTLTGNATLILADNCQMNVGASSNRIEGCGIAKSGKWSLTITSQSIGSDMGALSIYTTGPNNYAIYAKDVTINGGNITADTNTDDCPAVTADDNITINGGTVNANTTGNEADAFYSDETFNYNGGIVNATAAHGYAIYVEDGNYNFSWRNATDRINIGATGLGTEDGFTATFASTMTDGLGNAYTGTIDADGITALNARAASNDGLTLQPGNSLAANQAPDGNYWTTYYNGAYGHVILDQENACAYTATHADGQLTLHRLGTDGKTIPADCAVIIVADNPEVSMTVTNADPFTGDNDLRGFDSEEQLDNIPEYFGINGSFTYYVLGMTTVNTPDGPEKHFGFHRYTGTTMPAHKAFLLLPAGDPNQARSLDMVFGDETGIKTTNFTNSTNSDDAWYDMQGRRLGGKPTAKGIYVNKGIKVVIK